MTNPEIQFPDGSKLQIITDNTTAPASVNQDTIAAVKAIIAEFPNAKAVGSVPLLP